MIRRSAQFSILAALVPALALASIGKVSALKGSATRTPKDGAPLALQVGSELELEDTISVAEKSDLKLTLADESVLALGHDSQLFIARADFDKLERKGFSAKLLFGAVWAKVKKMAAGSEAKFDVTTDRAVAGVRGTIFRVDATKLIKSAATTTVPKAAVKSSLTTVRVTQGLVVVEARVKAEPQPAGGAGGKEVGGKKERHQVAGPQQITQEQWEQKFVELQKEMQVTVGEELWKVGALTLPKDDELESFVAQNP